jgi:soluble lytic murein transglycosylase-like protein
MAPIPLESGDACGALAAQRRRRAHHLIVATAVALLCGRAEACWEQAAHRYGVNTYLLYAIAKTESNLNPNAINRNANGSYDIGLMQINSSWLPTLRRYGVSEKDLYEPCINIQVGAWVLANNMQRMGNSWNAVGAYNAKSQKLREKYALKVYKNLPSAAFAASPEQ